MSLFKDWLEDTDGYRTSYRIRNFFSPSSWLRLHKWRKQRADRGWSDRDAWGAGDHIAKITAEMLTHLRDHTYVSWPEWFKLNVKEDGKGAYKNLTQVINDINNYLEFSETTWSHGLSHKSGTTGKFSGSWHYKGGRKLSENEITARIKKHATKESKLYKKANKAMEFFGRHFSSFWD